MNNKNSVISSIITGVGTLVIIIGLIISNSNLSGQIKDLDKRVASFEKSLNKKLETNFAETAKSSELTTAKNDIINQVSSRIYYTNNRIADLQNDFNQFNKSMSSETGVLTRLDELEELVTALGTDHVQIQTDVTNTDNAVAELVKQAYVEELSRYTYLFFNELNIIEGSNGSGALTTASVNELKALVNKYNNDVTRIINLLGNYSNAKYDDISLFILSSYSTVNNDYELLKNLDVKYTGTELANMQECKTTLLGINTLVNSTRIPV